MFPFYSVLCIIAASSSVYLLAVSGLLFVYLDSMAQYAGSGLKLIVSADTRCSVMSTSTRCIQYTLWCQQILLPGRSAGLHGFRAATLLLPPNRSSLFACLAIGRSTISFRVVLGLQGRFELFLLFGTGDEGEGVLYGSRGPVQTTPDAVFAIDLVYYARPF